MANDLDLKIRIAAEMKGVKEALNGLASQVDKMGGRAESANTRAAAAGKQHENSLSSIKKQVVGLVAAYASLATVKGLIRLADEAKLVDARLKLATRSQEELKVAQQATYEIAQRTRSPLKETADLYAKIANSVKDQEYSQGTLLSITETINKSVQISGADQAAASAAMMQLGQGLASGALRGEELNSILEQTPRLADAIAQGMDITRGQLRAYGQEGKLTSEAVIAALEKQKGAVDAEFAELPLTVGASIVQLENNFMRLVAAFDASSGATATLAEAIGFIADHLSAIVKLTGILGTVIVATYLTKAIPAITAYIVQMRLATKANGGLIASMTKSQKAFSVFAAGVVGWEVGSYLRSEFEVVEKAGIALMGGLHTAWAELVGFFRKAGATLEFAWTAPFDALREAVASQFEQLAAIAEQIPGVGGTIAGAARAAAESARPKTDAAQQYRETIARINAETEAEVLQIGDGYAALFANAEKARAGAGTQGAAGGGQERKKKAPGGSVDQSALVADQVKRDLAELDRAYAEAEVSHADYFARRQALTVQAVDLEIAEHQRALASESDPEKRSQELTAIALLERQKNDVRLDAARGLAQAERAHAEELAQVRQAMMVAEGRALDVQNEQIVARYKDLIKRLEAEGDTAGAALVAKLIDREKADAALADLERRIRETMERLAAAEQSSQARVLTGDTAPAVGEEEQRQAREEALQQLREVRTEYQGLELDTAAAQASMAGLDQQIGELAVQNARGLTRAIMDLRAEYANMVRDFAGNAVNAARDGLAGFFESLATGSKTGEEALRDFVRSFADSMARIASQALATFVVLQTLDAIYPGLGRATAATMGAGVHHTGGIAGSPTVRRNVPAFLFAGAPRYHGGGVAGLEPGEVPAILQQGEEVLTQDDPRHAANGGGQQQQQGVRILNVVDQSLVSDFMNSSSGEQVVVNTIQRNAGAIKQLLA